MAEINRQKFFSNGYSQRHDSLQGGAGAERRGEISSVEPAPIRRREAFTETGGRSFGGASQTEIEFPAFRTTADLPGYAASLPLLGENSDSSISAKIRQMSVADRMPASFP